MTDTHAKAVEAAALALINQDRARFGLPPHAASSEAFDEGRKATGIATTAITASLAAMRSQGWVLVRDCGEQSGSCDTHDFAYDAGWNDARRAMLGGTDDER